MRVAGIEQLRINLENIISQQLSSTCIEILVPITLTIGVRYKTHSHVGLAARISCPCYGVNQ